MSPMSLSSSALYREGGTRGVVDVVGPDPPDVRMPVDNRTIATTTAASATNPPPMSHGVRLPRDDGDPAAGCGPAPGGAVATCCGPLPYVPLPGHPPDAPLGVPVGGGVGGGAPDDHVGGGA